MSGRFRAEYPGSGSPCLRTCMSRGESLGTLIGGGWMMRGTFLTIEAAVRPAAPIASAGGASRIAAAAKIIEKIGIASLSV